MRADRINMRGTQETIRNTFSRRGAENAEKINMGMGIFCKAVSNRPNGVLHESREKGIFPTLYAMTSTCAIGLC